MTECLTVENVGAILQCMHWKARYDTLPECAVQLQLGPRRGGPIHFAGFIVCFAAISSRGLVEEIGRFSLS